MINLKHGFKVDDLSSKMNIDKDRIHEVKKNIKMFSQNTMGKNRKKSIKKILGR